MKNVPGQKERLRIGYIIYQIDRILCELRVEIEETVDFQSYNITYHNQMVALSIGYIDVWFTLRIKNRILTYGQKCSKHLS